MSELQDLCENSILNDDELNMTCSSIKELMELFRLFLKREVRNFEMLAREYSDGMQHRHDPNSPPKDVPKKQPWKQPHGGGPKQQPNKGGAYGSFKMAATQTDVPTVAPVKSFKS